MATWKKIIVSGSNAELNSATASFGFFGTASWAESASVAISSSYVLSSSYALNAASASWATNSATSSLVAVTEASNNTDYPVIFITSSFNNAGTALNSNVNRLYFNPSSGVLKASSYANISAGVVNPITSSWATNATTASFTVSSSFATTASFATSASFASTSTSASTILTQSTSSNATFYPSFVDSDNNPAQYESLYTSNGLTYNADSKTLTSTFAGNLTGTASWATNALTASLLLGSVQSAVSASFASMSLSSSVILTQTTGGGAQFYLPFVDSDNNPADYERLYTHNGILYNVDTKTLTSTFAGPLTGTASWATNAVTASFLPAGTYNITSSWAQSSSQAISSSYSISSSYAVTSSFAVSASWAPGGGGTPGGSNTSVQFNSASTFSGNNDFTYQYDPNDVSAYRLLHLYNYDFISGAINKNYPASYVPHNTSNPNSQRLGLSHFQISLASGTGATTIYRLNAIPNGNLTDLEMYGFKCDYSLLLIDTNLGSGNNVASRIGTLKAAWSWATANTPALNDDFVDGDLVYNELGLVTFTLNWNDPYMELQMDCTNITAGDTVFQGIFTNFGIR